MSKQWEPTELQKLRMGDTSITNQALADSFGVSATTIRKWRHQLFPDWDVRIRKARTAPGSVSAARRLNPSGASVPAKNHPWRNPRVPGAAK